MATINFATREITAKIVYFGAKGAGCNTNVERLWHLVHGRRRSPVHRFGFKDSDQRSWYFDYIPAAESPIDGFQVCWRLYSLPGGVDVAAHREEVMSDVDAVVFVADARRGRNQGNVDHLLTLEASLTRIGLELSAVPVVIQVNHTDAEDACPSADVLFDLNPFGFPVVQGVARQDKGVLETHEEITQAVLARVRDTLAGEDAITLTAIRSEAESDAEVIQRHVENIQARSQASPRSTIDEIQLDPAAPSVELAFQPREFVGSHPIRVLQAGVEGDQVRVDLEMERMGGGETRHLTVLLANRPTDTPPVPRASPPAPSPQTDPPGDRVFDYLPKEEAVAMRPDTPSDLPGYWYGVMGVAGGIVIGLLSAYLFGSVL